MADARPTSALRLAIRRSQVLLVALVVAASLVAASGPAAAASPVERVAGGDRVETSVRAARSTWSQAPRVLVATAVDYPDALAAAAHAATRDAPILLTRPDGLAPVVADALRDLGTQQVTILGGEAAVGRQVADDIAALGITIDRIAGGDRYDTAARIADTTTAGRAVPVVALALGGRADGGDAWPDALAASSLAGLDVPVPTLLTPRAGLSATTRAALQRLGPDEVLILGGPAAVPDAIASEVAAMGFRVSRADGPTRYGTAVDIAGAALSGVHDGVGTLDGETAVFVSGRDFPDALAAGALAARLSAPLLLVPDERLSDAVDAFVRSSDTPMQAGIVVGGPAAVSDFVVDELEAALTGAPRPEPEPSCPPNSSPDCQYTYEHPLSTWEDLADCESGGNWSINTGNGYYGGLQFNLQSWRNTGGTGYPHEHSKWEQIHRGEILQDAQGWGAWGSCARKLGLA